MLFSSAHQLRAQTPAATADEFVGLWRAKRDFSADARGPLVVWKTSSGWNADFRGRVVPVRVNGSELSFDIEAKGGFRARVPKSGRAMTGHWISPNSVISGGRSATPITLSADGDSRWLGTVTPYEDTFTLYLMIQKRDDGTVGAFIRNSERNIGRWYDVDHVVRRENTVELVGKWFGQGEERVLLSGPFDPETGRLTLTLPGRGGSYDFERDTGDHSGFYPRGRNPEPYAYRPPLARDDGWPTGDVKDANIDRAGIEKFIQLVVDTPMESMRTPMVEGVLVARHGKLVLEEYFHDEHRDKLHDTRSAAKSLTAVVVGAAMQAGAPLELSTPVYQIMNGGQFPDGLDPQKRSMTLEHLLTMSSGYYCDDTDENAPGNEDKILEQTEQPDYYRLALALPMASAPGEKAVYCSINPHLALGVVGEATGEFVLDTFDRLVAGPMKMRTYAWGLDPVGHPYGGGGVRLLPRDFMKLGQLMLDDGMWQGRRILSKEFATAASSSLYHLRNVTYGYYWWVMDYPYKDRTVRAYYAAGNGGQSVVVIDELDLVIAVYAANYAERAMFQVGAYIPMYILPCVREKGDDPSTPVTWREFKSPYGRSDVNGPVAKPKR
ncbi:MAG TPA: serine hydrolase [Candidatus Krumholzibacteria bacterium]|nr:serine hydrolase [Candidatus Krumholzibacteria bacterium]